MTNTMKNVRVLAIAVAVLCAIAFMPLLSDSMQSHAASKLKVSKSSATITGYGKTVKITAKGLKAKELKKVTWTSSNPKIATVNKKGKTGTIKAVYNGTATITAKYKKQTKKIKVTVKVDNPTVTGNYQSEAPIYGLLYQESAEVAALFHQAFYLAKQNLDAAIEDNEGTGEGLAIVTDIDSTIADDTCYVAGAVLDSAARVSLGLEPWNNDDWCGYYEAVATTADRPLPSAKEFIGYAYSNDVEIYYITNRPYYELDLTVKQLNDCGFFDKYADKAELLETYAIANDYQEYHEYGTPDLTEYAEKINATGKLEIQPGSFSVKDDYRIQVQGTDFDSDKGARRANAKSAGNDVIMYMGDSINDMVSDSESDVWGADTKDFTRKQFNETRTANASKECWAGNWDYDNDFEDYEAGHWGTDFIVMPNATYGDWYKATWKKQSGLSRAEQQQYIYDQIWRHSYKNTELYTKWYDGNSPVDSLTQ